MKKQSLSRFERVIQDVDRLSADERIALAKYIAAQAGLPRLFTSQEVEHMLTALVEGSASLYKEPRSSGVLVPRGAVV